MQGYMSAREHIDSAREMLRELELAAKYLPSSGSEGNLRSRILEQAALLEDELGWLADRASDGQGMLF